MPPPYFEKLRFYFDFTQLHFGIVRYFCAWYFPADHRKSAKGNLRGNNVNITYLSLS